MRTKDEVIRDARRLYQFLSEHGPAPERADLILAAGSHDVRVADHAAGLFQAGRAPLILCSGGLGKMTEGLWDEPEAAVFARRCVALGVPEDRILLEPASTNTGENFRFSRALLSRMGIFPRTGIVVCKPYMAKRAWAAGTRQWGEVCWSVDPPPLSFEEYLGAETPLEREIPLMTGDFQRLTVYCERGFQAPVPIPAAMWEPYRRLVADGYDQFIIKHPGAGAEKREGPDG